MFSSSKEVSSQDASSTHQCFTQWVHGSPWISICVQYLNVTLSTVTPVAVLLCTLYLLFSVVTESTEYSNLAHRCYQINSCIIASHESKLN